MQLQTLRAGSKYVNMVFMQLFVFRDSTNFLMASLDKLGEDFNVSTLKGIFPYDFMTGMEVIDTIITGEEEIRTFLPPCMLKVRASFGGVGNMTHKRSLSEEEYNAFFDERGWKYDVKH